MSRSTASRRRFIQLWLGGTGVFLAGGTRAQAPLDPTPACGDGPTPRQTEGPYYTPRTPRKSNFRTDAEGEAVTLIGRVVDRDCRPVTEALIDLWHSDAKGVYDNQGFGLRGHQITDAQGRFVFETIMPGRYPGRTPHYHLMIYVSERPVLTTQLYFPNEAGNARDRLFDPRLVVKMNNAGRSKAARFDFVVNRS